MKRVRVMDVEDQMFNNVLWLVLGRPQEAPRRSPHRHRRAGRA